MTRMIKRDSLGRPLTEEGKRMDNSELDKRELICSRIESRTGVYSDAWSEFLTEDLQKILSMLEGR